MASKDKDLDQFLCKVDEIENIVKTLKYGNETEVKTAMKQADEMIAHAKGRKEIQQALQSKGHDEDDNDEDDKDLPKTKTGFSKTSINKVKDSNDGGSGQQNEPVDQKAFMEALERDAAERSERKKQARQEADKIKEEGNEEFRQGNYEKALVLYTEALNIVKDHTALWTNRAQTNIKLGKYEDALSDCDWALRVCPNCLKAYIHMARAHCALKHYDKAREWYRKAWECDPKKENMIKDYLAEVDRLQAADDQEVKAKELFDSGNLEAQSVVDLLEKVRKVEQLPLYYSGGFRIICNILQTEEEKTLFRTNGGINIVTEHTCFARCFSASPRSLSQEELDMLTAGVDVLNAACKNNDTNQITLLKIEGLSDKLMRFLEVKIKGQGRLMKISCVNLLHTVSLTDVGRSTVVMTFDMPRLLTVLFNLIRTNSNVAFTVGMVLNNLALDKKFKLQLRDRIENEVLPAFETLIRDGGSQLGVVPSCITTMMNLTNDNTIRSKLSNRKELWKSLLDLVVVHKEKLNEPVSIELVESSLGLLSNLTMEANQYVREFGVNICKHCLAMCKKFKCYKIIISRSLGLMSHILPNCIPSVDYVCEESGPEVLLYYVKKEEEEGEGENRKSALKGLTACTQINELARIFIVDHKGLGTLVRLLKSEDEVVVGNAALCLGHCTQVPKVATALVKTDIIKELLVLARDGKRPTVQQNCAILIAKLAQGDARHLEKLRELHGIEILHSCMKYLK